MTGATGFVGGALVDRLSAAGHRVRALVRDPARLGTRQGLVDVVSGDLDDAAALGALANGAEIFVHCAGVTFARRDDDYGRVNVDGARNAAMAAKAAGARFVHLSSISARMPDVSPYARSKHQSEAAVREAQGDWIAFRAPAIYGPGDPATLPYFKLVRKGVAAEPATKGEARASLLFVDDLAAAVETAFDHGGTGRVYELPDDRPGGRTWREIGETLARVMGVNARPLRAPRALLEVYHGSSRLAARLTGAAPAVRTGQLNEFFHEDWAAQNDLFSAASPWAATTSLEEGFAKALAWYQEKGWL